MQKDIRRFEQISYTAQITDYEIVTNIKETYTVKGRKKIVKLNHPQEI